MKGPESLRERVSIELIKAGVEDIPELIRIEKSTPQKIYSPMLEAREWEEELQNCTVYLIRKGDAVVGSLSYERKGADHAYISGLVVDSAYRGQGIGSAVLGRILNEDLKDVARVDLLTHPENERALNTYRALGFSEESRLEDPFGEGEPRLVMVRSLRPAQKEQK